MAARSKTGPGGPDASRWAAAWIAAPVLGAAALALAPSGWQAFTLLLLSPVAEEIVFRAGMQEELLRRRVQPWLATLATALAFVAAHALVRDAGLAILWLALPAFALGIAYDRWRSLPLCIALHAAMNALWWAGGSRFMPFMH
jgi:membrane protease YdiL (CAAX protease family)